MKDVLKKNGQYLWQHQYYNMEEQRRREAAKQKDLDRSDSIVSMDRKKLAKRRSTTFKGDHLLNALGKNLLQKSIKKAADNLKDQSSGNISR